MELSSILLLIVILLNAAWNGHVIRWQQTGSKMHSRIWHALGFAIRALLCVVIYLQSGWLIASIAAFVSWIPYNIIINLINKWPAFYLGNSSAIDRFLKKLFR